MIRTITRIQEYQIHSIKINDIVNKKKKEKEKQSRRDCNYFR